MTTHYTFIRDWVYGPTDNTPEIIVVEADPTAADPLANARTRAIEAGEKIYGGDFDDCTMEFLATCADISGLLIDVPAETVIRVALPA